MNIKQYPLLQYIIKRCTLIYNSEGLIILDFICLLFLIGLSHNVCTSRLCEGTDEGQIFIRKVWDCPQYMVIAALGGVGTYDV